MEVFAIPQCCIICNAHCTSGLCPGCEADLPRNRPCCPRCARPASRPERCAHCKQSSPIQLARVPLRYEFPIDALIHRFKYAGDCRLAVPLGRLMAASIDTVAPLPEVLIPVPLHRRRLMQRGFNQAIELGAVIAAELGLRLDYKSYTRSLATAPQASLDHRQRRQNLKDAFMQTRGTSYEHIAILDDIITTGATVMELARLARRTGTLRIETWALARAVLRKDMPRPA